MRFIRQHRPDVSAEPSVRSPSYSDSNVHMIRTLVPFSSSKSVAHVPKNTSSLEVSGLLPQAAMRTIIISDHFILIVYPCIIKENPKTFWHSLLQGLNLWMQAFPSDYALRDQKSAEVGPPNCVRSPSHGRVFL